MSQQVQTETIPREQCDDYATIFGALCLWNSVNGNRPLNKLPPDVWVPAHGAGQMNGERLQSELRRGGGSSSPWTALQWALYHGPEWTVAAALAAIGFWSLVLARREWKRSPKPVERPDVRCWWLTAMVLHGIARSALGAAVVALTVYLALAPSRIEHLEGMYQSETLQVRDPAKFWAGLKEKQDELAADQQYMQQLRKQVERDLSVPP
jgi:hypothetical protein